MFTCGWSQVDGGSGAILRTSLVSIQTDDPHPRYGDFYLEFDYAYSAELTWATSPFH
jgi:hypothetical protein